jgi:alpha-L-rhamnosidase
VGLGGAVRWSAGELPVSGIRFGRRTFLASSAGVASAAVVSSGGLKAAGAVRAGGSVAEQSGTPQARDLTANGLVDPVGVDPDGCSFAWTLRASGREVRQTGYRLRVARTDPGHRSTVWDSGPVLSARQAFVAYGGPALAADASYEWTVQTRGDAETWGPVSASARFTTALRDVDWTAQWLRPAGSSMQPDRVTYVRTEVTPPAGTLARATAYLAAAHTYRFFVDGTAVDAWPSFCYPDEQYARAVDLTGVVAGSRTSALGVLHRWYGAGKGRAPSAPGLLVQLSLRYQDGRHVVFGSDGTWKERAAEWLPSPQRNSDACDFVEWIDGRQQPTGWDRAGYDDAGWQPVTVIGPAGSAPFSRTYVQRTRITEHVVSPISVRKLNVGTGPRSVVVDFGAVYPARPRVVFTSGQAGATVAMHVGYLLDPNGSVSTTHGTQGTNLSYSYVMRDGRQTFEAFSYLGFRYLQIDGAPETIGPGQVHALARHAAMPEVPPATFTSSDQRLDAVWALTARSCLYCCHEQFVDTPTREKAQFLWDAANESEAVMHAYGEQNLSWQGLRDVARGQARFWPDGRVNVVYPYGFGARDIPTFTERYPEWLWRYYLSTGDRDTAVGLYPSASRVGDWLWTQRHSDTGLLYGLADVPEGDPTYGYDLGVVADTASNVLAVNALNRIAQLADLAGDTPGAATMRSRAAQLAAAVNARLTRADGTYVDGLDVDGTPSRHASQESNALALAYGVAPAAAVARIGSYVASLGIDVGPNHALELLRGLGVAGRPADVVRLLTDASVPGWAHILAAGGTFMWETWTPSDLIGDSMSHGWGSSTLVAMQEILLGASFMEPDAEGTVRVAVAPPRDVLSHASGSVPTVAGPLAVSWERRARGSGESGMALDLTVPSNAAAVVLLPAASASNVQESGVPIDRVRGVSVSSVAGGMAVLSVGSGEYRFSTT